MKIGFNELIKIIFRAKLIEHCTLGAALLLVLWNLVHLIGHYSHLWVHPHVPFEILPILTAAGPGLHVRDWVMPFQNMSPGEFRPRFLAYLFDTFDFRFREFMYGFIPIHPTFSLSWILTMGIGPYYLYKLMRNFQLSCAAAISGIVMYMTSVGFLFAFTMFLLPGKALCNVAIILSFYLFSELILLRPDLLLIHFQSKKIIAVLILIFSSLFLDEAALCLVFTTPIVFRNLFWKKSQLKESVLSCLLFLVPFVCFVGTAVLILPMITSYFHGYKFNYLASTFGIGGTMFNGKSIFNGITGSLTLGRIFGNFMSLVGISFVPHQLSPLVAGAGQVSYIDQKNNIFKIIIMIIVLISFFRVALKKDQITTLMRRMFLVILLFVLFQSLMSIRHIPIINGFYYGCQIAVFLSIIWALVYEHVRQLGQFKKVLIGGVGLLVAFIQIQNFKTINKSWIAQHGPWMQNLFLERKIDPSVNVIESGLSRTELAQIWQAWKMNELSNYCSKHAISSNALYLIIELKNTERTSKEWLRQ